MATLNQLFSLFGQQAPAIPVAGVTHDSRLVRPGFVFVAIPGVPLPSRKPFDGHDYIPQAVANGAVVETDMADMPRTLSAPIRLSFAQPRPAGPGPQPGEHTEMGWEVYPEGLYNLLMKLHRDYSPKSLYITENGAAFQDRLDAQGQVKDSRREAYLREHFLQAHRAIGDGAPLHGYFVWSLMDNFEWAYGYSKRFGLIYVDYQTLQRTVKQSGRWYAQVTRENGFAA